MQSRNLSPQRMFEKLADSHTPRYHFSGKGQADFLAWKQEALPEVLACLGSWPERVPLNPVLSTEWVHDGLLKQRWLIDVSAHISASLQINRPMNMKPEAKLPAILCCHGHGPYGKEPVMGNDSSAELRQSIDRMNYNYGHIMAQKGYVTYAIDWIGFGERNDANKPHFRSMAHSRDWCNLLYLHATMFGMTSLSINVTHGMAATDFALSQSYVDPDRLGVMGLSGGGTMTVWLALCDERLKAAEVICYSNLFGTFGISQANYCGMQIAPGLFALVDVPELQGLIAPRPLLVDIGVHDACFRIGAAMACSEQVARIYAAAGCPENFERDLFPGPHAWGGAKSEAFFEKHLKKR